MNFFSKDFMLAELKSEFDKAVWGLNPTQSKGRWSEVLSVLDKKSTYAASYLDNIVRKIPQDRDILEECAQKVNNKIFLHSHKKGLTAGVDDTLLENINEAAIFWELGLWFWEANRRQSFFYLFKSLSLLNYCHGFKACGSLLQDEADSKAQKVAGGNAKAARYAGFKAEVIRLLYEKAPEEGWKSKVAALKDIDADLCNYVVIHGLPLTQAKQNQEEQMAGLPRLILDWSRDDVIIKAVFHAVVKKKKSAMKDAE